MKLKLVCILVLACFADLGLAQVASEVNVGNDQTAREIKPKRAKFGAVLRINGVDRNVVLWNRDGDLLVKGSELDQYGVKADAISGDWVSLKSLDPGVLYDKKKSLVTLVVPPEFFALKETKYREREQIKPSDSELGAWLNYDTRFQSAGGQNGLQAFLEGTISTKWGVLQSIHVYNSLAAATESPLKRVSTSFRIDDPETTKTTILGDTYSLPGYWGTPVNYGGVRIARNFSLNQPGFLVSPNYTIKGVATSPSVVEVWEGSQRTYSGNFPVGPFSISEYTPIKNGMAQVVVRDVFGNVTSQSIPLYSTPQQLADGLDAYSLELGMLKRDGIYGETFFGASYRRGFNLTRVADDYHAPDWFANALPIATVEGRVEGVRGDIRVGAGLSVSSWLGNLTLSGATGQKQSTGSQIAAAPIQGASVASVTQQDPSINSGKPPLIWQLSWDRTFLIGESTPANLFAALTKPTNWTPIGANAPSSASAMYGLSVIPAETFSASLVLTESGVGSSRHSAKTLSVSKAISSNLSATVSFSKTEVSSLAMLSLSWNLGGSGFVSSALSGSSQTVSYAGSSSDSLDNWGMAVGRDAVGSRIDANYASNFSQGRAFAAISQAGKQTGYRAGVAGSLLYVDGGFWLGRPITESVVLVKTDLPDLSITTNNSPVGRTNGNGEAVVSNLQSGRINNIQINEKELPLGYRLNTESSTRVLQKFGGISKIHLSADKPGWMGIFSINGQPVQAGTRVYINERQFFASSKSVHAKNMPTGKVTVRIDDCEREIEVPQDSTKTIPKFKFNLVCEDRS